MSKQREALKLALKALERGRPQIVGVLVQQDQDEAMQAIREALAEPEQEPLTDEQISAIVQSMSAYTWDAHMLARLIEKAHGIGDD